GPSAELAKVISAVGSGEQRIGTRDCRMHLGNWTGNHDAQDNQRRYNQSSDPENCALHSFVSSFCYGHSGFTVECRDFAAPMAQERRTVLISYSPRLLSTGLSAVLVADEP